MAAKGAEVGKSLNITVLRNSSNSRSKASAATASANPDDQEKPVVKQVLKLGNANTSVEETRDGSVIFVGNRKNTVERVRSKRDSSANESEANDKRPQ